MTTVLNFNDTPGSRMHQKLAQTFQDAWLAAGSGDGPTIPAEFAAASITADVSIGDHVLFGTNTVVLPGTQVPEGVSTGALTLLGVSLARPASAAG